MLPENKNAIRFVVSLEKDRAVSMLSIIYLF
jgi:hypothetical protein